MKRSPIYIIFLLLLLPVVALAQKKVVQNRPYIDQRPFHYGILVGMNLQDIEIENSGFITPDGQQWVGDVDSYNPGFSVGLVGEMRLTDNLSLRATPSMHFGEKHVKFRETGSGELFRQSVKSTYISLPVGVKFAGERYNNYRPYLLAGASAMYDLTSKNRKALRLQNLDCCLEVGIGCDFYMPFFKFIPELKFCYGLANLKNSDNSDLRDDTLNKFRSSYNDARSKMIVLTFYFE